MKVCCLNNISPLGLERFSSDYLIVDDVHESELILVRSFNMLEMAIPENLLAVARAGAGVNNIPTDKMAEQGIVVFNTPGANANGVKELVLAGMLLASRDIVGGIEWVKENRTDEMIAKSVEKAKSAFGGTEIFGKTLGVIGLGNVGGKVAKAGHDLGMKVIGYDPYLSDEARGQIPEAVSLVSELDPIYAKADFISLHLPLLDSTRGMINADVLAQVKPGCVILNFSRDQLVDDEALEKALQTGIVKKYVTDFPNPATANMEGVIAIPHLGASTEESEDNCAIMAAEQLRRYVEEGSIINSVNFPRLDAGMKIAKHRLSIIHKGNDIFLKDIVKALENTIVIKNLVNKSKGVFGATVIDFDEDVSETLLKKLHDLASVIRIRQL